ncbi:Na/Pi cotransporter family protein [Desulfopila sp. IMCC35008]|uniref:Na/Pi cotransporter family protein n=1 Tax=Desulfopila sp. IMCC35008 TaxID=2653858 RepID=UPI0013D4A436|nr:Na/Pi cotransporter family protein [Desulfopila sp. IMCC35008]
MGTAIIAFKILGGLVIFMFSIRMLSDTMKRSAGFRLKIILEKATANPLTGMAAGAVTTFLVQSSSVTVLLLLGLVNAGIMRLNQAVYVILGSEIGTTMTAQIVAFKVSLFHFPLIISGFVVHSLFHRHEKARDLGEILLCLGLVFFAMNTMTDGARPLREFPAILNMMSQFGSFPLYGIIIGAVFTAITSSSSATTSLVIAMSMEGVIDLPSGIALIVGANLGTCVLELIATIGTSISARRTGLAQFMINMLGAVMIFPLLTPFSNIIAMSAETVPRQLANSHTVFNVAVSFLLLPFTGFLIKLLKIIIPGEDQKVPDIMTSLDKRILNVPALALSRIEEETLKMFSIVYETLKLAGKAFFEGDADAGKAVRENERVINAMNSALIAYGNSISNMLLTDKDICLKRALIHSHTDLERIADLAENMVIYADQPEIVFSQKAQKDLRNIFDTAVLTCDTALQTMKRARKVVHTDITDIETQASMLKLELRRKFILWHANEREEWATDSFYPGILRDLERISSHSYNIIEHFERLE